MIKTSEVKEIAEGLMSVKPEIVPDKAKTPDKQTERPAPK
jgi:hypothetical protein